MFVVLGPDLLDRSQCLLLPFVWFIAVLRDATVEGEERGKLQSSKAQSGRAQNGKAQNGCVGHQAPTPIEATSEL